MLKQMTEKDRARIQDLLYNHPASRDMADRYIQKGKLEGKLEAKQDAMCKYLSHRFGLKADVLKQKVQQITNLKVLDFVLEELFAASTIEEAQAIINDGINNSLQ